MPVPALSAFRPSNLVPARLGGAGGLWRATEVAMVVLLAVQAARLAWLLLPPAPLGSMPAAEAGRAMAVRPDFLAIDAFYPATSTAAAVSDASGLRLFAVRPAAAGGSAILAERDGPQRSHAVGEDVAPGVRLAEVHADHVVLDGSGGRSELRFASATGHPAARTAVAPPPAGSVPAGSVPAGSDAAGGAIDPAQLLAQAGLAPVESDGRTAGYTVIPRGNGAVLRQAGLQAGDVLLSVNGQELTPERYAELAGELTGAASITLTYRRDGQLRTATLQAKTP
jgi:general secretion pathway protein C